MAINWEPTGRPLFIYEPHQDDGVLFAGQVAAHHVLAEREVHVVLLTNGSTSSALGKVNGTQHAGGWWAGWHDPAREGYDTLNPAGFAEARTREWRASWLQLGVPLERQHLGTDLADTMDLPDNISQQYAEDVIDFWRDVYPDAGHYTMHWEDPHSDHAAAGAALRALRLAEPSLDARWLTKPEEAANAGAQPYVAPANLLAEVKAMMRRACHPYGAWAPGQCSYAIGYHSVYDPYFVAALRGDPNHIVRNP